MFQTLPREATLASRVAEELEAVIISSQYQPGDRLPAERELARQFDVSRTVIREAVRGLVAKGLLEVRPGSGTVVRSPSVASVARSMSLVLRAGQQTLDYEEVHEVRRVLEIEVAGLAAKRRSPEDLAAIKQILEEAIEVGADRESFARNDVAFHNALALATHNALYPVLLNSVADVMLQVRELAFDVPGTQQRARVYHRRIYEEVRGGDVEGARRAMLEHLIESEQTMRRAHGSPKLPGSDQEGGDR